MELNQTLPNGGQLGLIALTIHCRKVGVFPQKYMGPKNFIHLFSFRRLQGLMANIFTTKRDIDQQPGKGVEKYEESRTSSESFVNSGTQTG